RRLPGRGGGGRRPPGQPGRRPPAGRTVTARIPLRFPARLAHRLPQPTSPDDGPPASPRLRRPLLVLALGCVLVRPLDEADDGPAAPHAQEVHRDEKQGQGCGDPLVEKRDRLVFVVLGDKNDDHRHDDQEEDQVNPSHGTPPARETGVNRSFPDERPPESRLPSRRPRLPLPSYGYKDIPHTG